MSSLPGYKLEDYLMWNWNLTAQGQTDANLNQAVAESLGHFTIKRRHLDPVTFKHFVLIFEGYREKVEERLHDFSEDTMSWRSYGSNAFDFISEEVNQRAEGFLALADGQTQPEKLLFSALLRSLDRLAPIIEKLPSACSELYQLDNDLRQAICAYADRKQLYRGQIRWNWAGQGKDEQRVFGRDCKDHPAVRGSNYMEIAKLLETSGCSKHDPWWSWEVLGVIDTDYGKLVVCPGDWIIEPIKGLYQVLTDDQFRKLYQ